MSKGIPKADPADRTGSQQSVVSFLISSFNQQSGQHVRKKRSTAQIRGSHKSQLPVNILEKTDLLCASFKGS